MGRLTGTNNDYCFFTCYENEDSRIREDCNLYNVCYERQMYERLKNYEELQSEGRLVELPCKVGDTVWEVDKPLGIIAEWRVTEFVIHEDMVFAENPYLGEYCDIKEFGKTVFLTLEEAEAALKGGEIDG